MATREETTRRLKQLADDAFYAGEPIMSNEEYDMMVKGMPTEPTSVGGTELPNPTDVEHFPLTKHRNLMLSIQDVRINDGSMLKDIGSVLGTHGVVDMICMPKFNGNSLSAVYEDGILTHLLTRGRGVEGHDMIIQLPYISGIPITINTSDYTEKGVIEIRGELLISRENYANYCSKMKSLGETPSDILSVLAAIRRQDDVSVGELNLEFIAHSASAENDIILKEYGTYSDLLDQYKKWGFNTAEYQLIPFELGHTQITNDFVSTISDMERRYVGRDKGEFDCDGIVVRVNDMQLERDIGFTSHHPRAAWAVKPDAELFTTTIEEIVWQVGKQGDVTPVAIFEPTVINGKNIRRSTLHNLGMYYSKGPIVGEQVKLILSAEVIPHIVGPVDESKVTMDKLKEQVPTNCPICNDVLIEVSPALICQNPTCEAKISKLIANGISKKGLDIAGLGPKKLNQLIDAGLIGELADIYKLKNRRDEIIALPGWAAKGTDKLLATIESTIGTTPAENFVYALQIQGFGTAQSKLICTIFVDFYTDFFQITEEEILAVKGFGKAKVNSWANAFADEARVKSIFAAINACQPLNPTGEINVVGDSVSGGNADSSIGSVEYDEGTWRPTFSLSGSIPKVKKADYISQFMSENPLFIHQDKYSKTKTNLLLLGNRTSKGNDIELSVESIAEFIKLTRDSNYRNKVIKMSVV